MRPRRLALIALAASALACHRPRSTPTAAPSPATSDSSLPAAAAPIAWLPADVQLVSRSLPTSAAIPLYLDSVPEVRATPCWAELRAGFTVWYDVWHALGGRGSHVIHWTVGRDRVERCAVDLLAAVGLGVSAHQDGAITEFAAHDGASSYVGWTSDGWAVWDDDRARVQALLAPGHRLADNRPLVEMLGRVDNHAPMWIATSLDLAGAMLGVPSVGGLFQLDATNAEAARSSRAVLVFRSGDDAVRAQHAVEALAERPDWSEATRQGLRELHPTVSERDLTLQPASVFAPTTLQELTGAAAQALAARDAGAAP